jgi:hypothetical protein
MRNVQRILFESLKERDPSRDLGVYINIILKWIGKGKAIPLQAWTGPEGSRRSRLPDF